MWRIQILADITQKQPNQFSRNCIAYLLEVEDSADISDVARLAIFVRGLDTNLSIRDELLTLAAMINYIFFCVEKVLQEAAYLGIKIWICGYE